MGKRKVDPGQPDTASREERRKHPRRPANRSAEVLVFLGEGNGGSQYVTATPVDYSAGGMQLETATPLEVGAKVTLRTHNPDKKLSEQGRAAARVVWSRQYLPGRYRMGVVFSNPLETLGENSEE